MTPEIHGEIKSTTFSDHFKLAMDLKQTVVGEEFHRLLKHILHAINY